MSTETTAMLPAEFAQFERFAVEWAKPTLAERYARRLASNMTEMREFYDALTPHVEDAVVYLNQFEYPDLPDDAINLLHLLAALSVISFAVDVFGQPKIPDSGPNGFIPVTKDPYP